MIRPEYINDYEAAKLSTQELFNNNHLGEPNSRDIANTFWFVVRV